LTATAGAGAVTGVEKVNFVSGSSHGSGNETVTLAAYTGGGGDITANSTVTIDGSGISAGGTLIMTDSADAGAHFSITGSDGADNIKTDQLTISETLSGGAGADTLWTGTAADSITGGEGADTITGGAGNDTIVLTESSAAADKVVYATGTDGRDTIIGFASGAGTDVYDTNFAPTAGNFTLTTVAAAAGAVTLSATGVNEISGTLQASITDFTSGAQVLAAISGTSVSAAGASDLSMIVLYSGGNAYLYEVNDADASTTIQSSEITLVGTFQGITSGDFATGDIA